MSVNSDRNAADERSQQLADESAQNNAQIAGAIQPIRAAISAFQEQQTSEFHAVAAQSDKARPPLGAAIEAAQSARDAQFHAIGRQLNTAVGLPPAFPSK